LATDPGVLLAEHPNATLAPEETQAFGEILKEIVKRRGIAALVLTADQTFARSTADDVLMLEPATGTLKSSSGWRRWFS
jgi:ABC-type polar amino acid transport system ATPase subunit